MLNASLAASPEACASSCGALEECRWWTWCDAAAGSSTGCPLSAAFTPLADLPTDAGTCLVSADPEGLGAAFVMDGGAGWAGGQRLPAAPAVAPAPSGAGEWRRSGCRALWWGEGLECLTRNTIGTAPLRR